MGKQCKNGCGFVGEGAVLEMDCDMHAKLLILRQLERIATSLDRMDRRDAGYRVV